jgi:hypothetical protein
MKLIHNLGGIWFRSAIDTARNGYAMQNKIGNHIQQNRIRSPQIIDTNIQIKELALHEVVSLMHEMIGSFTNRLADAAFVPQRFAVSLA